MNSSWQVPIVHPGEENYRQIINRVKNPKDAALALDIVRRGRAARAVLEQHIPFTFHTSQLLIHVWTCNHHHCSLP